MEEIHEWLPIQVSAYSSKSDTLLKNATNLAIDQITSSFDDSVSNEDTRGEVIILDHAEPGRRFSSAINIIEPMVVNGLIQIHRVVFGSGTRLGEDWYSNMVQLSGGKELVLPTKRDIRFNELSSLDFAVELANDKIIKSIIIPPHSRDRKKYSIKLKKSRTVYLILSFSLQNSNSSIQPIPKEELLNAFTILRQRINSQIVIKNSTGEEQIILYEPSEIFFGSAKKEIFLESGNYVIDVSKALRHFEMTFYYESVLVECRIIAKSTRKDPYVKFITHRLSDNRIFLTASFINFHPEKVIAEIYSLQVNASYFYKEELELLDDGKISDMHKNDSWFTASAEPFPCPNTVDRPTRYGIDTKCTTGLVIKLTASSGDKLIVKHKTLSLQDVKPDCDGFVFERQCLLFTKQRLSFVNPQAKCKNGRFLTREEATRIPRSASGINRNRIMLEKHNSECYVLTAGVIKDVECASFADGFFCVTPLMSRFALSHVRGVRVEEFEDEYQVSWDKSADVTKRMSYTVFHIYSSAFNDTSVLVKTTDTKLSIQKTNNEMICPPHAPLNIFFDLSKINPSDFFDIKKKLENFRVKYFKSAERNNLLTVRQRALTVDDEPMDLKFHFDIAKIPKNDIYRRNIIVVLEIGDKATQFTEERIFVRNGIEFGGSANVMIKVQYIFFFLIKNFLEKLRRKPKWAYPFFLFFGEHEHMAHCDPSRRPQFKRLAILFGLFHSNESSQS